MFLGLTDLTERATVCEPKRRSCAGAGEHRACNGKEPLRSLRKHAQDSRRPEKSGNCDTDRDIANAIVDAGRRLAPPREAAPTVIEYYPRLLMAAVVFAALALLFARTRSEAWLQAGLAAAGLALVARVLG